MIRMLLMVFFVVSLMVYGIYYIDRESKIKRLFTCCGKIPLAVVTSFSIKELVDRLQDYYNGGRVSIEYADNKYLEINTSDRKVDIYKQIESIQAFMVKKRYEPDKEYVVNDSELRVMHELWLDYSYKENYKDIFLREIADRHGKGELSMHSYNLIYKRFKFIK